MRIKAKLMTGKIFLFPIILFSTFLLTACGSAGEPMDPDTAILAGEKTLSRELYQWYLIQAYDAARAMFPESKELLSEKPEGEKAEDWIFDKAVHYGARHMAVENAFEESGLTITEEVQTEIEESVETFWNASGYYRYYSDFGIDEAAFQEVLTVQKKEDLLYEKKEEELIAGLTQEEITDYYNNSCAAAKFIAIPFPTSEDDSINYDELNNNTPDSVDTTEIYESFQKQAQSKGSLDELIDEAEKKKKYKEIGISVSKNEGAYSSLFYDSASGITKEFFEELKEAEIGEIQTYEDTANQYWILYEKTDLTASKTDYAVYEDTLKQLVSYNKFKESTDSLASELTIRENEDITRKQDLEELFTYSAD